MEIFKEITVRDQNMKGCDVSFWHTVIHPY